MNTIFQDKYLNETLRLALCIRGNSSELLESDTSLIDSCRSFMQTDVFLFVYEKTGSDRHHVISQLQKRFPYAEIQVEDSQTYEIPGKSTLLNLCVQNQEKARELFAIYALNNLIHKKVQFNSLEYDVTFQARAGITILDSVDIHEFRFASLHRNVIFIPNPSITPYLLNRNVGICEKCLEGVHNAPHLQTISNVFAFGSTEAMSIYANLYLEAISMYQQLTSSNPMKSHLNEIRNRLWHHKIRLHKVRDSFAPWIDRYLLRYILKNQRLMATTLRTVATSSQLGALTKYPRYKLLMILLKSGLFRSNNFTKTF